MLRPMRIVSNGQMMYAYMDNGVTACWLRGTTNVSVTDGERMLGFILKGNRQIDFTEFLV